MTVLPHELGNVIHEYKVDSSLERKIGWAIAITGFAFFGMCFFANLGGFPRFFGAVWSVLGTGIALDAFIKRNNRLVVYELGLVQTYAWRTEAYRWIDMAAIDAFKHEHYSSGLSYGVDYRARIRFKNGGKRKIGAVGLNRHMIDYLHGADAAPRNSQSRRD